MYFKFWFIINLSNKPGNLFLNGDKNAIIRALIEGLLNKITFNLEIKTPSQTWNLVNDLIININCVLNLKAVKNEKTKVEIYLAKEFLKIIRTKKRRMCKKIMSWGWNA